LNRSISEVPVRLTLFQKTRPTGFNSRNMRCTSRNSRRSSLQQSSCWETSPRTVGDFFEGYRPAPVDAIFNDLDLYTSTRDSPKLLDNAPEFFLPRLFFYFDDVVGTELEMYSECATFGDLGIQSYSRMTRIGRNQNLLASTEIGFRYQIYYGHLRSHPRYHQYVGSSDQKRMESLLALRAETLCGVSRAGAWLKRVRFQIRRRARPLSWAIDAGVPN
jgi:hypothetical protein